MTLKEIADVVVEFVREREAWAVPIVFALAFGESLAFVSLILPSTAILVAIGGLLGASGIAFLPIWLAAGIGGALGYAVSYWFGLYFKDDIARFWPFSTHPGMLDRGQRFFERYGVMGVFFGHFFGPVRAVIPVVAGMVAMRQLPFQVANVSSAFIWAGTVLAPAVFSVRWLTGAE